MNEKQLWLLRHFGPKINREAIIGDLLEKTVTRTPGIWLWREVFAAVVVGFGRELQARWPEVAFALAGTAWPYFSLRAMTQNRWFEALFGWGVRLGWPLSSVYDFGYHAAVWTLMLTVELAAILLFKRALTWWNLGRGILISFPMLLAGFFLSYLSSAALPHRLTPIVLMTPFFLALLISSWTAAQPPSGAAAERR